MVVRKHLLFSNALTAEGFLVETTLLKLLHEIHMDLLLGLKLFLLKLDALQSVLKIFHLLEILLILISLADPVRLENLDFLLVFLALQIRT